MSAAPGPYLALLVKGALIVAVLAFAGSWDPEALGAAARQLSPGDLLLAWVFMLLFFVAQAARWRDLLKACGLPDPPGTVALTRIVLAASCYTLWVPTWIGHELARVWMVTGKREAVPSVVASVFAERVVGLVVLLGLGAAGAPLLGVNLHPGLVAAGLLALALATPFALRRLPALGLDVKPARLVPAFLWSAASQAAVGVSLYLVARPLDDVSLGTVCAACWIASLASAVPVSFAGVTLREGAALMLLQQAGMSPHAATLAVTANLLLSHSWILLGGAGDLLLEGRSALRTLRS